MSKKIDIINQKFNHLTVLEDLGSGKVICQCDCENKTVLECYKKNVKSGRQKSCGCASRKKGVEYIVGQQFGNWVVLQELGYGKVLCECQCKDKTVRELYKKAVVNGQTKSCGCMRAANCNDTKQQTGSNITKYKDQTFGEWTVISRIPNTMKLLCKCSCGVEKPVYIQHLLNGESKSCGHNMSRNLEGQVFGEWTVIKELGNGKVLCNCSCKKSLNRELYKQTLIRGQSRSCGCMAKLHTKETLLKRYNDICTLRVNNPREKWQIDTLNSKDMMLDYLNSLGNKPTLDDLANDLNVTKSVVSRVLHTYNLFDRLQLMHNKSYMETDLYNFIKSVYKGDVLQGVRDVLDNNKELDIYIPDRKLAIEFNGNYWHSDYFKDKYYHQQKTIECAKKGIRLIHIFEYEWCNNTDVIQRYLLSILCDKTVVYARNTVIKEVSYDKIKQFLRDNHIQGDVTSAINVALYSEDALIGLMTFGKPRFNNEAEYELLRLCYLYDTNVVGGTEKMFRYFIRKYNPNSIVSYCSIDKFVGNVYKRIGFDIDNLTEPNYIWCDRHNCILSRYQTQRHKLKELGFTDVNMTEDDIMHELDYYKIYNSGNLKLVWNKSGER